MGVELRGYFQAQTGSAAEYGSNYADLGEHGPLISPSWTVPVFAGEAGVPLTVPRP